MTDECDDCGSPILDIDGQDVCRCGIRDELEFEDDYRVFMDTVVGGPRDTYEEDNSYPQSEYDEAGRVYIEATLDVYERRLRADYVT